MIVCRYACQNGSAIHEERADFELSVEDMERRSYGEDREQSISADAAQLRYQEKDCCHNFCATQRRRDP